MESRIARWAILIALAVLPVYAVSAAGEVWVDDFDDVASGWEVATSPGNSVGYQDGEYEIRINSDWWVRDAWSSEREPFHGFRAEATAYFQTDAEDAELGICWGLGIGSVYFAGIKADGTYAISHILDGEWQESLVDWTGSPAILSAGGVKKLSVIVEEGRATFLANDTELASVRLSMEGPYVVGLYGATNGSAPAVARFTQFAVEGFGESDTVVAIDLLVDDFDDETTGWDAASDDNGHSAYVEGGYEIRTVRMYGTRVAWAPVAGSLEDFRVRVSGLHLEGSLEAEYGIVWGTDVGNAYYAGVTGEGEYSVRKTSAGLWEDGRPIDWTMSDAVRTGERANSLELTVRGRRATLAINDGETVVLDVETDEAVRVGLYVSSHSFSPAAARFTRFEVAELPTPEAPAIVVDEFDDASSGWLVQDDFLSAGRYEEGDYVMEIKRRAWIRESWAPIQDRFERFRAEVTGTVFAEPVQTPSHAPSMGICFSPGGGIINEIDVQIPADTAYYFSVTTSGGFLVANTINREWPDGPVEWTETSTIRPAGEPNTIAVVVEDQLARCFINGEEVTSFEVAFEGPYYVGTHAFTSSAPTLIARVTRFEVEDLGAGVSRAVSAARAALEGLPFDEFVEVSYRLHALREPQHVATMGLAAEFGIRNDGLDDYSYAYVHDTFAIEALILDTLHSYDPAVLTPDQRIVYAICDWYWDDVVRGQAFYEYDHLVHSMAAFNAIGYLEYVLNDAHPFTCEADVADYVARLQRVGAQIDQLTAEMDRRMELGIAPPRRTLEGVLPALERSTTVPAEGHPFYKTLAAKASAVEGLSSTDLEGYLLLGALAVELVVQPAYQRLHDTVAWLAESAPESISLGALPGGDEAYAYMLRHHTQTELTAAEIHELGLQQVARVQDEIRREAEAAGIEDTSSMLAIFEAVNALSDAVRGQEALDYTTQLIRDAERLVIESGAFSALSDAQVIVEGASVGGFYSPASLDGSRPAKFLVTTGGATEFYRMATVAYHEAIPGHHLQVASAQEMDLPLICRDIVLNGFVEGWALYAERLMSELGAFDDDPLGNLGRLQLELMRAVRLVVDTGIHALGWTYDDAVAYVMESVGESEGAGVYRVTRYTVVPGQATAYMVGLLEILDLRELAREVLGETFDLAEFHDVILGHGNVPLPLLRDLVETWIAEKQG